MTDRWDIATQKLTRMTEAGEIRWTPSHDLCRRRKEVDFIGPAYVASVEGRTIAIYEYRFEHWDALGGSTSGTSVKLEFVDENLEPEWSWSSKGREELLEAVRYNASHADSFLDSFLQTA